LVRIDEDLEMKEEKIVSLQLGRVIYEIKVNKPEDEENQIKDES
jgi:hypothetical protein